jgi:hypothetical protein
MQFPLAFLLEGSVSWNVPLICAIIGAVLLGTGILGNGVKVKEIELPKLDTPSRVIAGVVGGVLLGISIWLVIVPSTPKTSANDNPIPLPIKSSCRTPPSINNPNKQTPLNIVFANVGTIPLKVFWIDLKGNKAQPFDLVAGASQPETSYEGHQWVIEDVDGKCVSTFKVLDHAATVNVSAGTD